MAGIYIHIPFCKQACHYCDFHFSTLQKNKPSVVKAICKELELQKKYLNKPVTSIYFGGGTPSLLTETELNQIFESIYKHFEVKPNIEITLEANPDDLTKEKIAVLKNSPINRLSIGVQSFFDEHLKFMNRAHSSLEAKNAILDVKNAGFEKLSLDLIYGVPYSSHQILEQDLEQMLEINPEHISAYCLTIEEKTTFGKWSKTGKLAPINDDFSAQQFEIVMNTLRSHRFEQYEVSNFCRDEQYAVHNSSYWLGNNYLGIGPGAHSYNTHSRSYNIANNAKYVQALEESKNCATLEILTERDKINDYILTGIRTKWGIDTLTLKEKYNYTPKDSIASLLKDNFLIQENTTLRLTEKGLLFADWVAEKLFL